MQLRCRHRLGKDLSKRYLLIGYTEESILHLTVGKDYLAVAISLWRGCLQVLVSDDNELPNWFPIECFDLINRYLPVDWLFCYYDGADLQALWGYRTLVEDYQHYDALLSRDRSAIAVFNDEIRKRRVAMHNSEMP